MYTCLIVYTLRLLVAHLLLLPPLFFLFLSGERLLLTAVGQHKTQHGSSSSSSKSRNGEWKFTDWAEEAWTWLAGRLTGLGARAAYTRKERHAHQLTRTLRRDRHTHCAGPATISEQRPVFTTNQQLNRPSVFLLYKVSPVYFLVGNFWFLFRPASIAQVKKLKKKAKHSNKTTSVAAAAVWVVKRKFLYERRPADTRRARLKIVRLFPFGVTWCSPVLPRWFDYRSVACCFDYFPFLTFSKKKRERKEEEESHTLFLVRLNWFLAGPRHFSWLKKEEDGIAMGKSTS